MSPEEILTATQAYLNGPLNDLTSLLANNQITGTQAAQLVGALEQVQGAVNPAVALLIAVV